MFEPLKDILNHHGENFGNLLASIRAGIVSIASNTEAQLVRNQFARKSVELAKKGTGQIRNDSAYGWLIKWAASTTKVRIFIGNEAGESFLLELPAHGAEPTHWYVPVGGVIFVQNQDEEIGYTNLQCEVMVSDAVEGHSGDSEERIEVERREPVPSGSPQDTVTIP